MYLLVVPGQAGQAQRSCPPRSPSHTLSLQALCPHQPGPGCTHAQPCAPDHRGCPSIRACHAPSELPLPPGFPLSFMTTSSPTAPLPLQCPSAKSDSFLPLETLPLLFPFHLWEQTPWAPLGDGSVLCTCCHAVRMKSSSSRSPLQAPLCLPIRCGLAGLQSPGQAGPQCCFSLISQLLPGSNPLHLPNWAFVLSTYPSLPLSLPPSVNDDFSSLRP